MEVQQCCRGGCVHHDNIAALLQCNSPKYPCRRGILRSESIVIIIQHQIQHHTPLHMMILRDHVI